MISLYWMYGIRIITQSTRTVRVNNSVAMPTNMQSIQIGMYYTCWDNVGKVVKNVASMRIKGVNDNVKPLWTTFHETLFLHNLNHVSTVVIEFQFFNRIQREDIAIWWIMYLWIIHAGINFHGGLHLDINECWNEKWNFLNYGRIGKHPMQSLYRTVLRGTCTCSYVSTLTLYGVQKVT